MATDLGFTEFFQKLGIKRSAETIAFAEKQGKGLVLNKFEVMSFAETYTDLIAFVLRFVESFALAEKNGLTNTKRVFEVFQVAEGLVRQIALRKYETLALVSWYGELTERQPQQKWMH